MATLFVLATPIGNLEDVSYRVVRVLSEVDALACEDTRHTRKLLQRYRVPAPPVLFSYHEHNEHSAGRRIIQLLTGGSNVALCSDAGMPSLSDPGYRIISECRERGVAVEVLPGADAVTTALVASGLPTSSFTFLGFPPRRPGPRRRLLAREAESAHTVILYESPFRVAALLEDARQVLGNRLAAVCIELTKKFEQIRRGYLAQLAIDFADEKVKGEVTVVIAGNHPRFARPEGPEMP
jgi:16S rRNA (cytidine1402-2'-O)-methyltransferase